MPSNQNFFKQQPASESQLTTFRQGLENGIRQMTIAKSRLYESSKSRALRMQQIGIQSYRGDQQTVERYRQMIAGISIESFFSPEIIARLKHFDDVIKAQQDRLETLDKIINKESITQQELDHLKRQPELSDIERIATIKLISNISNCTQ